MVAKEIGRGLVPLLRVSSNKTICRLKRFIFLLIKFFRCPSRSKKFVWLVIISFMASWAFYGICGRLSFSSMSLPGMDGEIYHQFLTSCHSACIFYSKICKIILSLLGCTFAN